MKVLNTCVGCAVAILLSSVIVSGCATNRINLVDTGKVDVVKISSRSAYFSKLVVYPTDTATDMMLFCRQ